MNRVRSVDPFTEVMIFTEPLNVLDAQSSFDHTFGLDQIMLQIIKYSKR